MEFRFVPLQSPRLTYKCVGLQVDQSNHSGLALNQSNHLNDNNSPTNLHSTDKQPTIIISTNFSNYYRHDNHQLENNGNRHSCTSLKTRLSYTDDHGSESSSTKGHNLKQLQQTTQDLNGISDLVELNSGEETPLSLLRRKQTKEIGKQNLVPFESGCVINRNRFSDNVTQQRPFSASGLPPPPFKATIYRPINLLDVADSPCSTNKKRKRISDTTCIRLNRENIQKWLLEHGIKSRLRSFSSSNFHHWRRSGPFIEHGTNKHTSLLAHTTSQSHGDRLHEPCRSSLVIAERLNRLAPPMTSFSGSSNKLRHSLRIEKKSVISLALPRRQLSDNGRPISDVVHDQKTRLLLNQQMANDVVRERKSDPMCHAWRTKNHNNKNEKGRVSFELENDSACHELVQTDTLADDNKTKIIERKENTITETHHNDKNILVNNNNNNNSKDDDNNKIFSVDIKHSNFGGNGSSGFLVNVDQHNQQRRISENAKNDLHGELRLMLTQANNDNGGNNEVVYRVA